MRTPDQRPSVVFFGTDEFAAIILKALKDTKFQVIAEIIKAAPAKELKLPVANLGVVAVYGKILPTWVLDHFPNGILNVHPSLLPKYRGPSPIRTAIANGDEVTGVTIIKLNDKMDEGDIVANEELQMKNNETHSQLRDRLAKLGAQLLIKTIPAYLAGKIMLQPQDHLQATYTKLLTRDDGKVDLQNDSPQMIYNKSRAYEGWPGIWFTHKGKRVKIIHCKIGNWKLEIGTLQPEGKKPMSLQAFINGYGPLPHS